MKFTVGIPAYKAKFLKECIDSVLCQTYSDFELVIVNDASPENIDDIISSYDNSSIRYYKNEKNIGSAMVVQNWNRCLDYAEGTYFILLGDDDKMTPEYLEEFSNLIGKYPDCNVYHCRSIIMNEEAVPLRLTEPRPEFERVYDSILERMRGHRFFFISDYVFHTQHLKSNGGFYALPLAWASDDITSYIASEKGGIAHTNRPVFMYRQSRFTISTTGDVFLKMEAILGEEKWLKAFLNKDVEGFRDRLLRDNIKLDLKKFIQKKKIRTIYASVENLVTGFVKWFPVRKKYGFTAIELLYALLLSIKEKAKRSYE